MKKEALRERLKDTFAAAGLKSLKSERVDRDRIHCIQHVAWEIDKATSGGNTRVRLYIAGHGYNHYLAEQDAPTADKLYWYKEPTWLIPGERLEIEVDQAQAGTTAEAHLTGYSTEFTEGIV